MEDSRIEPFAFACHALDIAGFDTAPIGEEAFQQIDEAGAFELVFDVLDDYELAVGYDADAQRYRIAVALTRVAGLDALLPRALGAHHEDPRATRRYSVDPERRMLVLSDTLDAAGADPVDLAELIAEVLMAMYALCKPAEVAVSAGVATPASGFIRG
jgi:hypothetical protein